MRARDSSESSRVQQGVQRKACPPTALSPSPRRRFFKHSQPASQPAHPPCKPAMRTHLRGLRRLIGPCLHQPVVRSGQAASHQDVALANSHPPPSFLQFTRSPAHAYAPASRQADRHNTKQYIRALWNVVGTHCRPATSTVRNGSPAQDEAAEEHAVVNMDARSPRDRSTHLIYPTGTHHGLKPATLPQTRP